MKTTTMRILPGLLLIALMTAVAVPAAQAQEIPRELPQRQIRGYIPPDQLVSFRPETPFDQFVDFLNVVFQRITGKQLIDPEARQQPIGVSIAGMHFLDALEFVLRYNDLTYRETERFYIIEQAPTQPQIMVDQPGTRLAQTLDVPATLDTREIQINAVLFSVNKTRAKSVGIDWNVFFGGETSTGGQQGGTAGGAGGARGGDGEGGFQQGIVPRFFLRTNDLADAVDNVLLMPDQIDVAVLTQLFRLLETNGAGETIANPRVTVQSGEEGRIQIGTDFPFVTRDFSGNTITQFVSTGIIINVTPTLISEAMVDTAGAPTVDFIHLNIQVENSNGQISQAGPIVDRSTANTQVLLLDGEQTIIGGLYNTEESFSRRGIPILKDLPGWFFGIRYLTGVTQRTTIQRELVILLQAKLTNPLKLRMARAFEKNLLQKRRQEVLENLRGLDENAPSTIRFDDVFEEEKAIEFEKTFDEKPSND